MDLSKMMKNAILGEKPQAARAARSPPAMPATTPPPKCVPVSAETESAQKMRTATGPLLAAMLNVR